ncbi:MAG: hypothetical protein ABS76_31170 [Pelagibacterium sp. SCN 64-44]|nr:MAG: hypothetical protein ABS76_31170 [Pelagibacterium sp. SCN 64-44]
MNGTQDTPSLGLDWRRIAVNFAVLAGCAFVLFVLAALLNGAASLLRLSTPEHLTGVVTALGNSSSLQAMMAIWLLAAAMVIVAPRLWGALSVTTALLFDLGYGVLGALSGFSLGIGIFGGGWVPLVWALVYSVVVWLGYVALRRFLPLSEMTGRNRWIFAAILVVAAPVLLLWG